MWLQTPDEYCYVLQNEANFTINDKRRIKLKGGNEDGISMLVGKLLKQHSPAGHDADSVVTQAYSFDKTKWTIDTAKAWIKRNLRDKFKDNHKQKLLKVKDIVGLGKIQFQDDGAGVAPIQHKPTPSNTANPNPRPIDNPTSQTTPTPNQQPNPQVQTTPIVQPTTVAPMVRKTIKAKILVTQADVENLNRREYTPESLQKAVNEAQEAVNLGLIIGYERHPDAVYDVNGEPAGYNYTQNPPIFRLTKLWFDNGQVWAEAKFFLTRTAQKYIDMIKQGKTVSVSLRALGECQMINGTRTCSVDRIDGLDVVPNPAMKSARVTEYAEIADSKKTNTVINYIDLLVDNNSITSTIDSINGVEQEMSKYTNELIELQALTKTNVDLIRTLTDALKGTIDKSKTLVDNTVVAQDATIAQDATVELSDNIQGEFSPLTESPATLADSILDSDLKLQAIDNTIDINISSDTAIATNLQNITDSKSKSPVAPPTPPSTDTKVDPKASNEAQPAKKDPAKTETASKPTDKATKAKAATQPATPAQPDQTTPNQPAKEVTEEALEDKREIHCDKAKCAHMDANGKVCDDCSKTSLTVSPIGTGKPLKKKKMNFGDSNQMNELMKILEGLGASPEVLAVFQAFMLGQGQPISPTVGADKPDDGSSGSDTGMGASDMSSGSDAAPSYTDAAPSYLAKDALLPEVNHIKDIANFTNTPSVEKHPIKTENLPEFEKAGIDQMKDAVGDIVKDVVKGGDINKLLLDAMLKMVTAPKAAPVVAPVVQPAVKAVEPAIPSRIMNRLETMVARDEAIEQRQAVTDAVEKIFIDGKVDDFSLTTINRKSLLTLKDRALAQNTPSEAISTLKMGLELLSDSALDNQMGHKIIAREAVGKSTETLTDDQSWKGYADKIDQAIASNRQKYRPRDVTLVNQYADVNKIFLDQVMNDWEAANGKVLNDFARRQRRALNDGFITDAALVISNSDFRNQPILSRTIIRQIFQRLTAMQYVQGLGPGAGEGRPGSGGQPFGAEFKIPVLSYNPPVHNKKRYIGPTDPIPGASSHLGFESFYARTRGISFAISDELRDQLENGALGIDPVSIMIDDISQDMARAIDDHIYEEMQQTCDEYLAVAVTGEATSAGNTVYRGAGSVAFAYDGSTVTYGTTVIGIAKALGGAAGGVPIVLPRDVTTLDASGATGTVTNNPISLTFASTTQVRGMIDPATNNIVAINTGDVPTYAVDFERGVFIFNAASGATNGGSGVQLVPQPTLNYSYVTNYVNVDLRPTSGVLSEDYYNTLLNIILQESGRMESAPRYRMPDVCLFPSSIAQGTIGISSVFHTRKSPTDAKLAGGFAQNDYMGTIGNINIMKTNGNMFAGDRRAILFQRYMTGYGVQMPATIQGPLQTIYVPSGGGLSLPTAGQQWLLEVRDVVGTPLPRDANLVVINHPGKTIRFLGTVTA